MSSRCLFRLLQAGRPGVICLNKSLHIQRTVLKSGLCNKSLTSPQSQLNQTRQLCASAVKFELFNVQDTEDFQKRVLESSTPVVVDFHASWCGPCKMLGPRLESIISQKAGKVALAKVDIDDHSELAIKHSVQAVPTVVAIKNGKVFDRFVGLVEDDIIHSFVEKLIN